MVVFHTYNLNTSCEFVPTSFPCISAFPQTPVTSGCHSFLLYKADWETVCGKMELSALSPGQSGSRPAVSLVRLRYRHRLTAKIEIQASARHLFKKVQFFRGSTCLLLGADSRLITSFWWWPGWSSCSICKRLPTFSSLPVQYLTHKTIWCSSFLPITFG